MPAPCCRHRRRIGLVPSCLNRAHTLSLRIAPLQTSFDACAGVQGTCSCGHASPSVAAPFNTALCPSSVQTNFDARDYTGETIPPLTGKTREEVKTTLKSERIKQVGGCSGGGAAWQGRGVC